MIPFLLHLVVTSALPAQMPTIEGRKLPAFFLPASDGKRYSQKTITADTPTFLIFLKPGEPGHAVRDMNLLMKKSRGRFRLVGVMPLSRAEVKSFVKREKVGFLVLADGDESAKGRILPMITDPYGQVAPGDNFVLLQSGIVARIWRGYNRSTLQAMAKVVTSKSGKALGIDFAAFPVELQRGEVGRYGLPPPRPKSI